MDLDLVLDMAVASARETITVAGHGPGARESVADQAVEGEA
jgi:hypothetical protein